MGEVRSLTHHFQQQVKANTATMDSDFQPFLELATANFTVFDESAEFNVEVASCTCSICELVFDSPPALNEHFLNSRNCVEALLPRLGKDKAKAVANALLNNGQSQRSSRELKRNSNGTKRNETKRSEALAPSQNLLLYVTHATVALYPRALI